MIDEDDMFPTEVREINNIVKGITGEEAIIALGYNMSLVIELSDSPAATLQRIVETLTGYRDMCMVKESIDKGESSNDARSKD